MFLAFAAALLLAVVAVQDYFVPALRERTISEGLAGPLHWFLDGAYVVLAVALALAFRGHGLAEWLALATGAGLVLTATTKTFADWVNKFTNHSARKLHSFFTILMFLIIFWLEGTQDHGWMWALTAAGVVVPAALAFALNEIKLFHHNALAAAEKAVVVLMSTWMIAWSVLNR